MSDNDKKEIVVVRKGGRFEGIGFLTILLGMASCAYFNGDLGFALILGGFVVFIVGRCM